MAKPTTEATAIMMIAHVCVSKNYAFLGFLSLSGGVTYSLEKADGDDDINGYVGVEKSVGSALSLLVEYDLATNDNSGDTLGRGRGYLNAALRWAVGGGVTLGCSSVISLRTGATRSSQTDLSEWNS